MRRRSSLGAHQGGGKCAGGWPGVSQFPIIAPSNRIAWKGRLTGIGIITYKQKHRDQQFHPVGQETGTSWPTTPSSFRRSPVSHRPEGFKRIDAERAALSPPR